MNTQHILEFAVILGFAVAAGVFLVALLANINYRITPFHLEISMMGMAVRRIPHHDIKSVSVRRIWFAERWCNTLSLGNRRLVIERRSGWFRNVVISPPYRFVFRSALAEARRHHEVLRVSQPHLVAETPGIWEQVRKQSWVRRILLAAWDLRRRVRGQGDSEAPVPQYLSN